MFPPPGVNNVNPPGWGLPQMTWPVDCAALLKGHCALTCDTGRLVLNVAMVIAIIAVKRRVFNIIMLW